VGQGARQLMLATAALLALLAIGWTEARATHDRNFWVTLRSSGFKLPPGEPALPLALEAAALLGSTDSELRDDIAYEALETWVYREQRLSSAELGRLRMVLSANARQGLGEEAADGLFLRSFSLLALALLAAEDLKRPFLDVQQFDALLDLAVTELASERDLRGYVAGKGWGHATAHCADLMKFLARNHWLRPEQQSRIVDAVAGRLRSAGLVFVWGEDARLAAALSAVAQRPDADPAPFLAWFQRLREEHEALWRGPLEPARYIAVRAQLNALTALAANLDMESPPPPAGTIRTGLRSLRAEAQ
jgi:Protein of unknown function (DUF2785)